MISSESGTHVLLLMAAIRPASTKSGCPNFNQITDRDGRPISNTFLPFRCEESAVNNKDDIYGTGIYTADSCLCKAALHAGVIGPEGGTVQVRRGVTRHGQSYHFVGTTRNRVQSMSKVATSGMEYYYFKRYERWIPGYLNEATWMSDVILVHNSYNGNTQGSNQLWVTCLYETNRPKEGNMFYTWNFIPGLYAQYESDHRITFIDSSDQNRRIVRCFGRTPFMDVEAVISKPSDDYLTVKSTFTGVRGRQLTINFQKFPERAAFFARLPDKFNYKSYDYPDFENPRNISEMTDANSGDFIVGKYLYYATWAYESYIRSNGAYFQVYIQDCDIGNYGSECNKKCNCQNDAVCHPVIGACICRPGFFGLKCENRCKLDHFGSKCQFDCTSQTLGEGIDVNKRNCKGLVFCLPETFGCSCAFGYKGLFCHEYEELHLPYLTRKPTLNLTDPGNVALTFSHWNAGRDPGDTYGFEIVNYLILIQNSSSDIWQIGPRIPANATSLTAKLSNVTANATYTIIILVELENFTEQTERPSIVLHENITKTEFSLPCLDCRESPCTEINQTSGSITATFAVPSVRKGYLECLMEIRESKSTCSDILLPDDHNYMECKVDNLASGELFTIDTWCENEIGKCARRTQKNFTLANLSKSISCSNSIITLKRFFVLHSSNSNLMILRIQKLENLESFAKTVNEDGTYNASELDLLVLESWTISSALKQWEKSDDETTYIYDASGVYEDPVTIAVIFTYGFHNQMDLISVTNCTLLTNDDSRAIITYSVISVLIGGFLLGFIFLMTRRRYRKPVISALMRIKKNDVIFISAEPDKKKGEDALGLNLGRSASNDGFESRINAADVWKKRQKRLPKFIFSKIGGGSARKRHVEAKPNDFSGEKGREPIYMNIEESTSDCSLSFPEIERILNGMIYSPKAQQDFHSIPMEFDKPTKAGNEPQNVLKNRYKNNLPYDDTRVVLSEIDNDPFSNYINSSFVKGLTQYKWYIASQGPKDKHKETMGDFWRMVVEMEVEVILMVANFVERGKVKVGRYFSCDGPLEFHGMTITVLESFEHPHFLRRNIQISSDSFVKFVVHYQFVKWPDHGSPVHVYPICSMLKSVMEEFNKGGIIVHCSAGIGRTGSILLVLLLKEILELNSSIDPLFVLRNLRECRTRLVENIQQYNFSLEVFHYLLFSEKGLISSQDLEENHHFVLRQSQELYLELQEQPFNLSCQVAQKATNLPMNRDTSTLPADLYLVSLDEKDLHSGYINAIYIDLHETKRAIIATQYPTNSTLYSFWQMIVQKNCSSVILVNDVVISEEYPSIYSLGENVAVPEDFNINVQAISKEIHNQISCFEVTISRNGKSNFIEVYQVSEWPICEECPADLSMLETVSRLILSRVTPNSPILLCCGNGVTGCGLVVSSAATISQIQLYDELNIYYAVVKMRRFSPHFITSQKQFVALYEVACQFLQNNSSYQNFSQNFI